MSEQLTTIVLGEGQVMSPLTGEILDCTTADGLISAIEEVMRVKRMLWEAEDFLRAELVARAGGKSHVEGETRRAKLERPADRWDQKTLKQIWTDHPAFAQKYLRIAEIAPNLRDVKTLENTACEGETANCRALLLTARTPSMSLPTIKIER